MAGLVTAATGGVGLYLSSDGEHKPAGDTYNIIEAAPVPAGDGEVDAEELDTGLPDASGDDEITALVDGCLDGFQSDCDALLYKIAVACSDGDLGSCDDLFLVSAYGSPYEDYGATCGGRYYDWTYAGDCISAPL